MSTIERRLVDTLEYEASRLPDIEAAKLAIPGPSRSKVLRPGFAAPAAFVAVMILAAPLLWLVSQRGGSEPIGGAPSVTQPATTDTLQTDATTIPVRTFTGQLGSIIDLLPTGFNPETAISVYMGEGTEEEVVADYVQTRNLVSETGIAEVEEQDGYTLARWAWGQLLDNSGEEQGESGWLLMRPTDTGFEILAATTDGVDLSNIAITDGNLRGVINSNTSELMGADVLSLDGTPVPSAPNPEGSPDALFVWGTATTGTPPLALDLPVTEPVNLRVNRVGGTLLSISEVTFG